MKDFPIKKSHEVNVIVLHKHLEQDARILKHLEYLVNEKYNVYHLRICRDNSINSIKHLSIFGELSITIGTKLCDNSIVNSLFFNIYLHTRYFIKRVILGLEEFAIDYQKPTIIHVHDPVLLPLAVRLNNIITNGMIVYDRHEVYESGLNVFFIQFPSIGRVCEIICHKKISGLVCVAESQLAKAKILFACSNCCVVNNFPDTKQYDLQKIHKKIDSVSSSDIIYLSYVGSLDYHGDRNIDLLLDVVDNIMQDNSKVFFILGGRTGDIALLSKIDTLTKRYPRRFNYLGYVSNYKVIEISQQSHIGFFLLKNIKKDYKVSPNKVFEYQFCGCVPVIKANMDCAEKLLHSSIIYSEDVSKEEIIHDIRCLIKTPDLLQEKMTLSHNIGKQFTWQSVAQNYKTLYNELISIMLGVEKQ